MKYFFLVLFLLVIVFSSTENNLSKTETPTEANQPEIINTTENATSSNQTKEKENSNIINNIALYEVIKVIDGDTIEVLIDGEKKTVRYIGMNTPETVHPSKPVECFGVEASNKNKELVTGKKVRLVKDISETDKYGRLLRYVYVDDNFINLTLVQEGYAYALSYPPDLAFSDEFKKAEQTARENKLGLWGDICNIPTENSQNFSQTIPTPPIIQNQSSEQCTIKGNINSEGEKIYHTIGCGSYNKTQINEDAGERWFCTESEAKEAGWRKALNC
jgi:micrococcal nuclease